MLLGHLSGGADFWAIKRCKHKSKPTEKKSHILPSRRLSQPLAANSKPQMQQRNYNVDRARVCVCVKRVEEYQSLANELWTRRGVLFWQCEVSRVFTISFYLGESNPELRYQGPLLLRGAREHTNRAVQMCDALELHYQSRPHGDAKYSSSDRICQTPKTSE